MSKEKLEKLGYSESNILDMLRDSQDSGHDSPGRERRFRSCRVVRRRRKSCHLDSCDSSEELNNIFSNQVRISRILMKIENFWEILFKFLKNSFNFFGNRR